MESVDLDELIEAVHKYRTDQERNDLNQFGFQFSTEYNNETRRFTHTITKVNALSESNVLRVNDELIKINGFNACLLNSDELRSTICESMSKTHKDLIFLNLAINRKHLKKQNEGFLSKEELELNWQKPVWKIVRIVNRILLALFVLAIAIFIGVVAYLTPKCEPVTDLEWWQNSVCFKVDLDKLTSRCETYTNCSKPLQIIKRKVNHFIEMKANCIWLGHMNNLSAGFDQINSSYGSIDDFKQLLDEYHRQGLKVLVDFIPNYTNDDHVWFKSSVTNETWRDFYVWTETPNNWLNYKGEPAWTELASSPKKLYYLHQFDKNQPDLNYENPLVYQMLLDSVSYWLDFGVDGLNLLSISRLFEDKLKVSFDNRPVQNERETFHLLAEIKSLINNLPSQHKLRNMKRDPIIIVDSRSELNRNDKQLVSRYYGNDQMSGVDLILSHLSDETGLTNQVELDLSNAIDNKKSPFWMPSDLDSGLISFLPGSFAFDYDLSLDKTEDNGQKSLKEILYLRSSFKSVLNGRLEFVSSTRGLIMFKRTLEPELNILVIVNLNQTSHATLDNDSLNKLKQLNIRNKKLNVEFVYSNGHENRTKLADLKELVFDKNGYLSTEKSGNGLYQLQICSMCGFVASWPYEAPDLNDLL